MPAKIHSQNVPGPISVTDDCIACTQCVSDVPEVFRLCEAGYAFAWRQPEGAPELAEVRRATERCPVEAIHERARDRS